MNPPNSISSYAERATRRIITRSGLFDADFYRDEYPDVAAAGLDALEHYRIFGWREGRRPGPAFDATFVADGPISRRFPDIDPVLVWYLLGRWLGWKVMAPEVGNFFKSKEQTAPSDLILVVHEASRTGAPIFALRLVRWLCERRGVSPLVVLLGGGPLLPDFFRASPCIPLFAVPHAERGRLIARCSARHGTIYYNSLAALSAWDWAPSDDRSVVIHCHEGVDTAAAWGDQMRAVATVRPKVISVSSETGPFLSRALGSTPEIVPPAIDVSAGRHAAAIAVETGTARRPIVVGCGVRSRRKGADLFCDIAASMISKHGSAIRFRWVGRQGDVDMEQYLCQLGIRAQVELVGEVADPLPHLARASALLLPSREDPFPLVALEAASCGIPVFCFDSLAAGVGTWIGAIAGAIVPSYEVDLMAATLAQTLCDPKRLATLGEGARRAAEAFDMEAIGPRIANVIWPDQTPPEGKRQTLNL
jgi:glycosyltransferase involved in cell wall biosynthesis